VKPERPRPDPDAPTAGPPRPRDSSATRRSLLAAARELFATDGYDGTTVRAIAERAGVNQALLFRHFGNKEQLFAEAVAGQALDVLHDGPPQEVLRRTLEAMLATGPDDSAESTLFFAALRSQGNTEAARTVRAQLREAYGGALAALVATDDPADAELRADLTLAWLLGIALLRRVIHSDALTAAEPETVIGHVVRATDALLGPVDST
jgi:AcrR family transcriptional regulator